MALARKASACVRSQPDVRLFERPYADYDHGGNRCSVTGGYVYRGEALPELAGAYIFGYDSSPYACAEEYLSQ